MEPRRPSSLFERFKHLLLDLDAMLDDSLYRAGLAADRIWDRLNAFSDMFHVRGWRKWLNEILSEGANLGTAGLVLVLALAVSAFRETSEDFLKRVDLSVTILDRYGNEVGRRGIRHDDSVPLDDYPDHMIKAVLATEDRRFFEHFGIDFIGTLRAVSANARAKGVVQGGSSLTQQLAKNLFLNNERTIERKIKEAFLAVWLETRLTKKQILKLYLDRAYMGGGAVGAEAAAEHYFGKSIREVTLAEAAMLAGLFKAPTKFAPHVNLPAARSRAATVLDNLVDAGFMTEGQVFGARRNPATPVARKDETVPDYYLDFAFDDVKKLVEATPWLKDRVLTVRTGLDMIIQKQAEEAVETILQQYGAAYRARQASVVTMDTEGVVRAIVGGRDYGESQFNRAVDALRQPGSSFKPIVYAAAFDEGILNPRSIVVDRPTCIGNWCPNNYGRSFAGSMTATIAIVKSINTIPVQISQMLGRGPNGRGEGDSRIGRRKIIEMAQRMGIRRPLTNSAPLPIGAAEVTLLDLTSAYGTLAAGGKGIVPSAVLDIRNTAGEIIWRRDENFPKPKQAMKPQTAADMNQMMVQVVEAGTGRRALVNGVQMAGKTGTTNGYRDALFVGYSGHFVTGVWFGNDDFTSTANMTGGSLPAMTFKLVMAAAHQGLERKPVFGQPDTAPVVPVDPKALPVAAPAERPQALSRRSAEVLGRIGTMFESLRDEPARAPGPLTSLPVTSLPAPGGAALRLP